MANDDFKVYVGLVDFADPTLLIVTDASGFRWLAQLIASRQSGDLSRFSSEIELPHDTRFHLRFSDEGVGLERHGSDLFWNIAPTDAGVFAAQLRSLADTDCPGHHYLDPTAGIQRIEVIASKGEYNPITIFSDPA
jgi:hypothetical protein